MARGSRAGILVIPLLIAAASILAGCEHDRAALAQPAAAAPAAPAPAVATQPAAAPAPEEPVTEQQASAACWMKFERGRRDLPLEARAALVDKCIDERMKGAAR